MLHQRQAKGAWYNLSFLEQVANIGSEVERTISWKEKGNDEYSELAFVRSLELFDLTLNAKLTYPQLKEICRAREMWADYIYGDNQYKSTSDHWRKYFNGLLLVLRMKYRQ